MPIHQPFIPSESALEPDEEQMRETCRNTIAFVMAFDTSTTPLEVQFDDPEQDRVICEPEDETDPVPRPLQTYKGIPCVQWAIEAACRARVSSVIVIASVQLEREISDVAAHCDTCGVDVRVVTRNPLLEREDTLAASNLEIFGVPYGRLAAMLTWAAEADESFERILVMSCDQVRVGARHLYEVLSDALHHPESGVVTSWIQFFPRTPLVISRGFTENLESSALLSPGPNGHDRPLPVLEVHDHLFGEERLAANPTVSERVESYLETREPGPATPIYQAATDAPDELAWADEFGRRCRLDFPIFSKPVHKELVYLDNAATTQRCHAALQAQRDYDENYNANVYRGTYNLSVASTEAYDWARKQVEGFIGADSASVAFVPNTTVAINVVAQTWGMRNLNPGDLIAIALQSHHSGIVPFQIVSEMTGAKIEYIPYDALGRMDRECFSDLMARSPKLVCIPHVSNVLGIEEPVAELAREAHSAGARVLVDAAQSLPHIPIDVGDLGADWVVFSGHKAYGPMGIGGLWISEDVASEMDPMMGGGGTIAHVGRQSYYLRTIPIQLELGTPSVSQAVGLAGALEYLNVLGMNDVRRHEEVLTGYLVSGLRELDEITIIGDHDHHDGQVGLVSFTLAGADSMDMVTFLGHLGIAARGGGHCALPLHSSLGLSGTVRISMGVYTTKTDIDALLQALRDYTELTLTR